VCAGKTTLARALDKPDIAERVSTRRLLTEVSGVDDRRSLQQAGAELDERTGGAWVAAGLREMRVKADTRVCVIDAVRIQGQIDALRRDHRTTHVHLTAPLSILAQRYEALRASRPGRELTSYSEVSAHPTEAQVEELSATADVVCDTGVLAPDAVLERVATNILELPDLPAGAPSALLAALDARETRS
jgi:hypothetical protein